MTRAVVFAYHNVGVRCLQVLLKHGLEIPLVVTHEDSPGETIWFESVASLAKKAGIRVITPEDVNAPDVIEEIRQLAPEFFFSFYYRQMLKAALLEIPRQGALNMHGSLLPKYRGRVPVNWAVIRGETETGASLHEMTLKPDQGAVLGREAVAIGPDETAYEVFQKVTGAAETLLDRVLPGILKGTAPREIQDLSAGHYFGGRRPEDGRIDWSRPFSDIHNLVRGVAPPYPGAFTAIGGQVLRILKTRRIPGPIDASRRVVLRVTPEGLTVRNGQGEALEILAFDWAGQNLSPEALLQQLPPEIELFSGASA